jgi:hypothetical protein
MVVNKQKITTKLISMPLNPTTFCLHNKKTPREVKTLSHGEAETTESPQKKRVATT